MVMKVARQLRLSRLEPKVRLIGQLRFVVQLCLLCSVGLLPLGPPSTPESPEELTSQDGDQTSQDLAVRPCLISRRGTSIHPS